MLTLTFNKSRSPKIPHILKWIEIFDDYEVGNHIRITLSIKEIFEKWQAFSDVFLSVQGWKGTIVSYDGMDYYSHSDKQRVFRALQNAHVNWIDYTENKINQLYKVYTGEMTIKELDRKALNNEIADRLIDYYNIKKAQSK